MTDTLTSKELLRQARDWMSRRTTIAEHAERDRIIGEIDRVLAADEPSAGVKCTHCNGKGYNEPIYDEQDGWIDETPCETCNGSGRITTVEQYLKTLPANWHEDSSLETWFPITAEELKRLKDERASQPPSDDLAFPLDARVREVFGQTEGTIVAIDSRYEVECTDGKHRFYWHRQLERVAETKSEIPAAAQSAANSGQCESRKAAQSGTAAGASDEPPAVDVAPIAKLTVRDGLVQRAGLYAPGLPDGDHDVFPVPLSPKGELRPHVLAEPPAGGLTAPMCPECGWIGDFRTSPPPNCTHPFARLGIDADGVMWCTECFAKPLVIPPPFGEGSVTKEATPSTDLRDYGYAPGGYTSHCLTCEQTMDFVDKRCRCCKLCAEKKRDAALAAVETSVSRGIHPNCTPPCPICDE